MNIESLCGDRVVAVHEDFTHAHRLCEEVVEHSQAVLDVLQLTNEGAAFLVLDKDKLALTVCLPDALEVAA